MQEGRSDEHAYVAEIRQIRHDASEIRLTLDLLPSTPQIINDSLWKLRESLDIEQFEFNRNHCAIKESDLFAALVEGGHEFEPEAIARFEQLPLPAPTRSELLRAKERVAKWGHTAIDNFLLEAGVDGLSAGKDLGSRNDRANEILRFVLEHPGALTAEHRLFTRFLADRAGTTLEQRAPAGESPDEIDHTGPTAGHEATDDGGHPNRVFIVHGHDDDVRNAVVGFLQSAGLDPIILHEQANMGRHLLTKFIEEAELVTFAVVLMTADDTGSRAGEELQPRARQNVILELGYFLAHLGQQRVCALVTPGLETPSDFDGIVYIRIDEQEDWKQQLMRELRAAETKAVRQEQVSINNVLITVPRSQGRELRVKVVNTGLRPVFVHTVGMYDSSDDRMMLFAESKSDQPLELGEPRLYGRNVVDFGKFKDHAPQDVWIAVHSHTKELDRAGGDVFLHLLREGLEEATPQAR